MALLAADTAHFRFFTSGTHLSLCKSLPIKVAYIYSAWSHNTPNILLRNMISFYLTQLFPFILPIYNFSDVIFKRTALKPQYQQLCKAFLKQQWYATLALRGQELNFLTILLTPFGRHVMICPQNICWKTWYKMVDLCVDGRIILKRVLNKATVCKERERLSIETSGVLLWTW
jgi:hypothetical protein